MVFPKLCLISWLQESLPDYKGRRYFLALMHFNKKNLPRVNLKAEITKSPSLLRFNYTEVLQVGGERNCNPLQLLLPREFCGQGSLVGCCPQGRTESDTTEVSQQQQQQQWLETGYFEGTKYIDKPHFRALGDKHLGARQAYGLPHHGHFMTP